MRTRIEVTFTAGTRSIDTGIAGLTIEDIRLIANETTGQSICYTGAKGNIASVVNGVVTYNESMTDEDGETELFPPLAEGDKITFEIDRGTTAESLQEQLEAIKTIVDDNMDDYAAQLHAIIGDDDEEEISESSDTE